MGRVYIVHSMEEAGASRWAPWWLLLLTRIFSCGGLFGLAVYWAIWEPVFFIHHIYNFGAALSFFLLVICTALHANGTNHTAFPTVALLIHGIIAVFSAFITASYIIMIFSRNFIYITTGFVPLILYILDILVMQSCMRLRYRCAFIAWFTGLISDVIILTRLGFGARSQISIADWLVIRLGVLGGNVVLCILGAFVSLFISLPVIAITRIRWPCFKEPES